MSVKAAIIAALQDEPGTARQIAERGNVTQRQARRTLEAMHDMGIVRRKRIRWADEGSSSGYQSAYRYEVKA